MIVNLRCLAELRVLADVMGPDSLSIIHFSLFLLLLMSVWLWFSNGWVGLSRNIMSARAYGAAMLSRQLVRILKMMVCVLLVSWAKEVNVLMGMAVTHPYPLGMQIVLMHGMDGGSIWLLAEATLPWHSLFRLLVRLTFVATASVGKV